MSLGCSCAGAFWIGWGGESEGAGAADKTHVLDDPLGVLTAEIALDVAVEGLGHGLPGGGVLDDGGSGGVGGGGHGKGDDVALGDREVKVVGVVWGSLEISTEKQKQQLQKQQ